MTLLGSTEAISATHEEIANPYISSAEPDHLAALPSLPRTPSNLPILLDKFQIMSSSKGRKINALEKKLHQVALAAGKVRFSVWF